MICKRNQQEGDTKRQDTKEERKLYKWQKGKTNREEYVREERRFRKL